MRLKKHQTLREQIVSSLRDSIIKGELNPGQKLTEPELAEKLGISRTPIREAFRQLESEGFLTVIPRRGAVVSRITKKEIVDFYELKSLLESYAARIAAEQITEKGIEKLKRINEQLTVLAEKGDVEAFFWKNDEFHNTFISYCGNEKLLEFRGHMVQRFMRFRLGALSVPGRLMDSVRQHKTIISALSEKDGSLAEAVVLEHALLSGRELAERVEQDATKEKAL
jgi:DNA-binding GntR family transcriptional regulator